MSGHGVSSALFIIAVRLLSSISLNFVFVKHAVNGVPHALTKHGLHSDRPPRL